MDAGELRCEFCTFARPLSSLTLACVADLCPNRSYLSADLLPPHGSAISELFRFPTNVIEYRKIFLAPPSIGGGKTSA